MIATDAQVRSMGSARESSRWAACATGLLSFPSPRLLARLGNTSALSAWIWYCLLRELINDDLELP